jgi:hypothetical protein
VDEAEAKERLRMRTGFSLVGTERPMRRPIEQGWIEDEYRWSTRHDVIGALRPLHVITLVGLLAAGVALARSPIDLPTTLGEEFAVLAAVLLVIRLRLPRALSALELGAISGAVFAGLGANYFVTPPFSQPGTDDVIFLPIWAGYGVAAGVAVASRVRDSARLARTAAEITATATGALALLDLIHQPPGRRGAYLIVAATLGAVAYLLATAPITARRATKPQPDITADEPPNTSDLLVIAAGGPRRAIRLVFLTSSGLFVTLAAVNVHLGLVPDAIGNVLMAVVALVCSRVFDSEHDFLQAGLLTAVGFGTLMWASAGVGWGDLPGPVRTATFVLGFGTAGASSLLWAATLLAGLDRVAHAARRGLVVGLAFVVLATFCDLIVQAAGSNEVRAFGVLSGLLAMLLLEGGVAAVGAAERVRRAA